MASKSPAPSGLWCLKQAFKGTYWRTLTDQEVPEVDLTGKWVIITGANSGIGFEAAKTFAKMGANLVLGCRNPPKWELHPSIAAEQCLEIAESAGHSSSIEWWEIDMADLSSVDAFAERWLSTQRALDLLCNNAGMPGFPSNIKNNFTKDGFEIIHQVNFLSHTLLTLRLLESIARSKEPRIVCTTSCMHYLGKYDLNNFNGEGASKGEPYPNNKLYYQMWIVELQRRLLLQDKYKHIVVNGLHPGYVNSSIWNHLSFGTGGNLDAKLFLFLAHWLAITPFQGSRSIVYVATSPEFGPDPKTQGIGSVGATGGGHYINRIWRDTPMPLCEDAQARLAVWAKVSEELQSKERVPNILETI
ncbi:hypothetical protein N7462_004416 [Penicillium macrosclerotiorum]|uniref:uncharacterized protein n=1 Tax=Penicillium macrosclerotiorum TaxID=303699 RepID=UPI00254724D1|nr:uncharacterized protein N7462_004416 [Penicillium macrosclerotiorum]KAJ5690024.1 hypothetical protein N7462_004416 [Penicillium macrosclerotiorum]